MKNRIINVKGAEVTIATRHGQGIQESVPYF